MEKIANLDLPSFSDRVQAEVVAAIQAELTATIDDLVNSVRHLALRAKLTESIVDAREEERCGGTENRSVGNRRGRAAIKRRACSRARKCNQHSTNAWRDR